MVFYYPETTTLDNISYTVSSPTTGVTLSVNVTEQSTENFTTYSLTTTKQNITTDLVETTTQNTMTSTSTESSTSMSLTTTVVTIETTETTTEKSTSSSLTTTAMRSTEGQWEILMDIFKLTFISQAFVLLVRYPE